VTARRLVVRDAGPLTTIQDSGRRGWAHLGVPRSGALDRGAAELSNRLVGNHRDAAMLETMLGGLTFTASTAMTTAVTGAVVPVLVDGRPQAFGEPVSLRGGQTVQLGHVESGLRSYVAVAGGIDVPPALGSRSTDTLSGIGPRPVTAGNELPVGAALGSPHGSDVSVVRRLPSAMLRFQPGPRAAWFTAQALETLSRLTYTVAADSNRIGLRLHGPRLGRDKDAGLPNELPSEGIVLGAIQVPASGQPLVFLNDHPTTGGYPVIGVVLPEDISSCAQLRPGDDVRFRQAAPHVSLPPR